MLKAFWYFWLCAIGLGSAWMVLTVQEPAWIAAGFSVLCLIKLERMEQKGRSDG